MEIRVNANGARSGDVVIVHLDADLSYEAVRQYADEVRAQLRPYGIHALVLCGEAVRSVDVARAPDRVDGPLLWEGDYA